MTRRLNSLNKLISQYENFTHEEELESFSKVYRYSLYAVLLAGFTLFVCFPLFLLILVGFGEAIVIDVVHNLKPDLKLPTNLFQHSLWSSRLYGAFIGSSISACFQFMTLALLAAKGLSADYRKKMLKPWKKTRFKLEVKLGLPLTDPDLKPVNPLPTHNPQSPASPLSTA